MLSDEAFKFLHKLFEKTLKKNYSKSGNDCQKSDRRLQKKKKKKKKKRIGNTNINSDFDPKHAQRVAYVCGNV